MVPLVDAGLHLQMDMIGNVRMASVPAPNIHVNLASVIATLVDFLFLAVAWEYLGKSIINLKLWLRAFLTLLGVMWLDVFLFTSGAFAGDANYWSIMTGTLISRFLSP